MRRKLSGFCRRVPLRPLGMGLFLGLLTTACGLEHWKPDLTGDGDGPKVKALKPGEKRLLLVNVNQSDDPSMALLSQSADTFLMRLSGCASGNAAYANPTLKAIEVFDGDIDCKAQLLAFTYSNKTFIPTTQDPFETWEVGDSALFQEETNPADVTKVTVVNQLQSPIDSMDTVGYSFSQIKEEEGQTITASSPRTVSVTGLTAPAFKVRRSERLAITPQGAGQFQFTFECANPMTGTGLSQTCEGIPLSGIRYRLVKDTFNSTLDISAAALIFNTGAVSVLASEVLPSNSTAAPNGGFVTPVAVDPRVLQGPDQIQLNPNMILVIEGLGTSYTYFNIDVITVNQNQP